MNKGLFAFIFILIVGIATGLGAGYELTQYKAEARATATIRAETDYYMKAVAAGEQPGELTINEGIELLRHFQFIHKQWLAHPEWYPEEPDRLERLAKERVLVRSYGKLIRLLEGL